MLFSTVSVLIRGIIIGNGAVSEKGLHRFLNNYSVIGSRPIADFSSSALADFIKGSLKHER